MNVTAKPDKARSRANRACQGLDDLAENMQIPPLTWQEPSYNAAYYAKLGLLLGVLGGCTSLAMNVIGSVLWPAISGEPQHPLRLIQVYLTFPLGESAMTLNSGILLALGCVVYLATGMLYGAAFVLAMSYFMPNAGLSARLVICCILAIVVWAVNFYLLLAWLQPLLLGGRWIAELVPWWVGAITHLVFGGTIALLYPLDSQSPYPKFRFKAVEHL